MKINSNLWNKIRYTIYTPVYDLIAFPLYQQRRESIRILDPQINDKILIIGAGTGLDLYYLKECNHITATDITPSMVSMIKLRARNLKMTVNTHVMDGRNLQFDDNSFDGVILHLILAVIPDPVQCLREAERVLKPGGKIIIFDKFARDNVKISKVRKMVNLLTNFLFSDITRKPAEIIGKTQLVKIYEKDALLGGLFRILKLEKLYKVELE